MKTSPRMRFWLVTIIFIVCAFVVSAKMLGLDEKYEEYVFFGWLVFGSIAMSLVRCPSCGTPLVFQGSVGGIPLVAGFANKRCKKCDCDLTAKG